MMTFPRTTRGGHRDRVGLRLVDRDDRPDFLAAIGVERDQPPVDRADEHLALPHRDPAVDRVAAGMRAFGADVLRVVFPQQLAGIGLDRDHLRPGGREIHHPVDHDRGRFLPAVGVERDREGEAELADIAVVDVGQRAEALLVIGAAIGKPVVGIVLGGEQPLLVDLAVASPGSNT